MRSFGAHMGSFGAHMGSLGLGEGAAQRGEPGREIKVSGKTSMSGVIREGT